MNDRGSDVKSQQIKLTTQGSAIVVGASLSGLMTGIALAHEGWHVTILERVGSKPRSGAVLQVDSGDIDQNMTAKKLRQLASGGLKSAEAWSSVQSRLLAEAKANPRINLRYETRISKVDQDQYIASVVTEKNEVVNADIVIGADGHNSIVRTHVAPKKPTATFSGYMIWVAVLHETNISKKNRPSLNAPTISMPNGIGDFLLGSIIPGEDGSRALNERRLGWAWYDNTRNDLLRKLGCVEGNLVRHSLNAPEIPEQTLKELAEQASARWPQPWLEATLHSIRTRNLTGIPIAEYVPDKIVKGRIALVGDAAHVLTPLSASGFNASLQDASTLSNCIAKELKNNSVTDALLEYESLRLKTVRQLVQAGQNFSRSFAR
jgi:2-polyprenyl-6-methoxyphenol hydroxylase-like FAD-dependent oxidoreductase